MAPDPARRRDVESRRGPVVGRRVLIVADSFYPSQGGSERVIAESSRALRQLGHRVVILAGTEDPHLPRRDVWSGVEIVRYGFSSRNTALLNLTAILGGARALSRVIGTRGPFDVAHCHGVFGATSVRLSRRSRHLPRVVTFHGPVHREFEMSQAARGFPRRPVRRRLQRPFVALYSRWLRGLQARALRDASCVVLSRYAAGLAAELLPRRRVDGLHVVPGGVDLDRFAPARDRVALRRALGLPPEGPLLLTIRRLVPRMGLTPLVDAIEEVRRHDGRAHLVIGGRGPLEATLRHQVEGLGLRGHVTLAGFVPEERLPLYYQSADLFVLPTIDLEGFGLVTLEALACGTPVLATRTGANPELLEPLGDRFLVDAPTAPELAKGIVRFLDGAAADPAVRGRCRGLVERRYSWARHAERLMALYDAVLSGVGTGDAA
jgi:glycosyltransferase involved in cell wall biosynthesis